MDCELPKDITISKSWLSSNTWYGIRHRIIADKHLLANYHVLGESEGDRTNKGKFGYLQMCPLMGDCLCPSSEAVPREADLRF